MKTKATKAQKRTIKEVESMVLETFDRGSEHVMDMWDWGAESGYDMKGLTLEALMARPKVQKAFRQMLKDVIGQVKEHHRLCEEMARTGDER